MIAEAPVIHVVDDDASFRTAVARLLQAADGIGVPAAKGLFPQFVAVAISPNDPKI